MAYDFDPNQPIYLQLLQDFQRKISKGEWQAGQRIDSVRNLALDYGVNPNTVQRALTELERQGLSYTERTNGRFITQNEAKIRAVRQTLIQQEALDFISKAKGLGMTFDQVEEIIASQWEKERGEISI